MEELREIWRALRSWMRRHQFAVDCAWVAPLLLLLLLTVATVEPALMPVHILLNVGLIAPLAVRRTHPTASVVAVYCAGLLALVVTVITGSSAVPAGVIMIPFALYSVALYGPRWAYRTAMVGALVGTAAYWWWTELVMVRTEVPFTYLSAMIVPTHLLLFAVWAFALMRRSRRDAMEALMDRARRLEVERDQQARIATAAERTRIAREMHDIVAHSLSVIIAQADGGRYAAVEDPRAATRALGTIADTGRDALTDMRRLLGVLRPQDSEARAGAADVGGAGGATAAALPGGPGRTEAGASANALAEPTGPERLPQPASKDLDALVEQARSSGVRASLVRLGTERPLPPGMGLTVYRVCQESLTNVLKHAGPDPTVTIVLRWGDAALTLEVSDDGRGAAALSDGAGQGLLGMRERATMFGGTLTTGPRPGGGFRVRLELPIPELATPHMTPNESRP